MAIPCDSKSVISLAFCQPPWRPTMTSPSSTSCLACRRPFSRSGNKSPASAKAVGTASTVTRLQRRTAASDNSCRISAFEPAALMCAPSSSHSASNSGCAAVVTVPIRSLPRTVSSADDPGTISTPVSVARRVQNAARRSLRQLNTFTRSNGKAAHIARTCPSACQPAPKTPATVLSGRASHFAATPLAAPVRIMPR